MANYATVRGDGSRPTTLGLRCGPNTTRQAPRNRDVEPILRSQETGKLRQFLDMHVAKERSVGGYKKLYLFALTPLVFLRSSGHRQNRPQNRDNHNNPVLILAPITHHVLPPSSLSRHGIINNHNLLGNHNHLDQCTSRVTDNRQRLIHSPTASWALS
ncbi:hypothetical protein L1987_19713 [Smallanthus sonchifolius]|uniref:Uncharacterized protein n=1 Tax=Smallanthus sonchifolius TaxID=185202 RepID=A0ACB9IQ19_9ASTR|nr:hypothetical protein L1987_19713 [Smallanthus sonchifolius]